MYKVNVFEGVHNVDFSGVRDDKCHTGVGESRVRREKYKNIQFLISFPLNSLCSFLTMYVLFTIHVLIVSKSPFCLTKHFHLVFISFSILWHFDFYFHNPLNSLTFWRRAGETDKADDLLWRRVHLQRRPMHRHGAEVNIAIIIITNHHHQQQQNHRHFHPHYYHHEQRWCKKY